MFYNGLFCKCHAIVYDHNFCRCTNHLGQKVIGIILLSVRNRLAKKWGLFLKKKNGSLYDISQALPKSVPEPHCYYNTS